MDPCNMEELKPLLERHSFRFSRNMGQNFLIASWVPQRMVDTAALDRGCGVVEIGPGVGALTCRLAPRAGKVVAIELDRALLPVLKETLADASNVEIVPGDVMKLDLAALAGEKLPGLRKVLCANLPYNITTPVLTRILEARCFTDILVMVQREAAERICAAPGAEGYGAFSVTCQYRAQCAPLFDISPSCFLPAPKVTSTVLRLRPWEHPPVVPKSEAMFAAVVRAAFAQRRKTLLNALSASGLGRDKAALAGAIAECGLPADVRGERLSVAQFAALADSLESVR